ncbi:MAG: hypothetical protein WD295_00880 [Bacteroidota bacterium]
MKPISNVLSPVTGKKRVFVFSPDADLARSLSMLLEGHFEIVCETRIEALGQRIVSASPALLLIDLFAFPKDIFRVLHILRGWDRRIPTIVLHVYQRRNPEVERAIWSAADLVLYKPLDVDEIGRSITSILGRPRS